MNEWKKAYAPLTFLFLVDGRSPDRPIVPNFLPGGLALAIAVSNPFKGRKKIITR
jgi:hypothetical protein